MQNTSQTNWRKVVSLEYVPAAKRTDNDTWLVGDTHIVTLDCGHSYHGAPGTKIGSTETCHRCPKPGR